MYLDECFSFSKLFLNACPDMNDRDIQYFGKKTIELLRNLKLNLKYLLAGLFVVIR